MCWWPLPGRLLDLIGQGYLNLGNLEVFVLDEADRMLDMGFLPAIKRLVGMIPRQRQSLFFSATMPPAIAKLAYGILTDPVKIQVAPAATPVDRISQQVLFVEQRDKRNPFGRGAQGFQGRTGPDFHPHQTRCRPGGPAAGPKPDKGRGHSRQQIPKRQAKAPWPNSATAAPGCWWPPT